MLMHEESKRTVQSHESNRMDPNEQHKVSRRSPLTNVVWMQEPGNSPVFVFQK